MVIDKLPFAPPDDPVVEAKIAWLRRAGRNPFGDFQLPQAVRLLQQGAGRLIRDEHDRGVLMILDERLLAELRPHGARGACRRCRTRSEAEAISFLTRRDARRHPAD